MFDFQYIPNFSDHGKIIIGELFKRGFVAHSVAHDVTVGISYLHSHAMRASVRGEGTLSPLISTRVGLSCGSLHAHIKYGSHKRVRLSQAARFICAIRPGAFTTLRNIASLNGVTGCHRVSPCRRVSPGSIADRSNRNGSATTALQRAFCGQ